MSRAGYSDDSDLWPSIMYRGAVASAIRGKRGQSFLRELLTTLDAMPNKRLIAGELESHGEVCAIGSVGLARGMDMSKIDVTDYDGIAKEFGIAPALVREIEYENDEDFWNRELDEYERWERVRKWVAAQIIPEAA